MLSDTKQNLLEQLFSNASFEELKSVLNEADAHNIINYFNN